MPHSVQNALPLRRRRSMIVRSDQLWQLCLTLRAEIRRNGFLFLVLSIPGHVNSEQIICGQIGQYLYDHISANYVILLMLMKKTGQGMLLDVDRKQGDVINTLTEQLLNGLQGVLNLLLPGQKRRAQQNVDNAECAGLMHGFHNLWNALPGKPLVQTVEQCILGQRFDAELKKNFLSLKEFADSLDRFQIQRICMGLQYDFLIRMPGNPGKKPVLLFQKEFQRIQATPAGIEQ